LTFTINNDIISKTNKHDIMNKFTYIGKTRLDELKNCPIEDCMVILSADLSKLTIISGYFDIGIIPDDELILIVIGQNLYKKYIQGRIKFFIHKIKRFNPTSKVVFYGDDPDIRYLDYGADRTSVEEIEGIQKTNNINADYRKILKLALEC
jgi:hypothetical protein